jgi:hypothetical protein
MATITLTIPDAVMPRVVDALCAEGGYVSGSRGAFAKQQVVDHVRRVVRQYESRVARDAAGAAADSAADAEILIT